YKLLWILPLAVSPYDSASTATRSPSAVRPFGVIRSPLGIVAPTPLTSSGLQGNLHATSAGGPGKRLLGGNPRRGRQPPHPPSVGPVGPTPLPTALGRTAGSGLSPLWREPWPVCLCCPTPRGPMIASTPWGGYTPVRHTERLLTPAHRVMPAPPPKSRLPGVLSSPIR